MLNSFYPIIKSLQPIASEVIALVAVIGLFNTRWIWRQSNRPIVSAVVETHSSGNVATLFNLAVINSGNRPATDIKLTIDNYHEFEKCIKTTDQRTVEQITRCFSKDATIPLLINGEKKTNYFGTTSTKKEQDIWIYGSFFSITIDYGDLEKKRYKSELVLFIKDSKAFASGSWGKSTTS